MKTQKIVILSLNVDGDIQASLHETSQAVDGLKVKYGPGGDRTHSPDLLPVVAKILQGPHVGVNGTIEMDAEERAKVKKFCDGTGSVGMYILVHATENYAGTAATRVSGSSIGAFVRDLDISVTHICVVACSFGAKTQLLDICKSFTEVASDLAKSAGTEVASDLSKSAGPPPPKVAGYNLPVFVDKDTGRKQVMVQVFNPSGSPYGKKIPTKDIRKPGEPPTGANKAARIQAKIHEAKVGAKKYKKLYVFANGEWSDTWM